MIIFPIDHNDIKSVVSLKSFEKRKAIFNWLVEQNADLCFLQETYSTEEIEIQWKAQWPGESFLPMAQP